MGGIFYGVGRHIESDGKGGLEGQDDDDQVQVQAGRH